MPGECFLGSMWPWCSVPASPEPPPFPPGWLPFYHNSQLLARSALSASLGIFEVLYRTLSHRFQAVYPQEDLPFAAPGRVSDPVRAQILLHQYTELVRTLSQEYVQRDGDPLPDELPQAVWPGTVPALLDALSQLQFVRETVLDIDVSIPLAALVRDRDVIGTWARPRFHQCHRVLTTFLQVRHGFVTQPVSPAGAIEARYFGQPVYYRESAPVQIRAAGSGPLTFQFPLDPLDPLEPGFSYFLSGTFTNARVEINGRLFTLDGPVNLDLSHILMEANLMAIRVWGAGSLPSWGPLSVVQVYQWVPVPGSSIPLPETFTWEDKTFEKIGPRPWGNNGGWERVSFVLEGVVEAFRGGPFVKALPRSFPAPRLDCWPRFLDPGMTLHLGFNAPSEASFSYQARLGGISSPGDLKAQGTVGDEITRTSFTVGELPYLNRVAVTAGSNRILDTVFGSRPGTFPDYYTGGGGGGGYGYGRNGSLFTLEEDEIANLV